MIRIISSLRQFTALQKKKIAMFFKISISVGLIAYLIKTIHIDEISVIFANANYYLIFISFILSFLNIYLQFYRWKVLCNITLDESDNKRIFLSLFYGFSGGIISPLRLGEYVGRSLALNDKDFVRITIATMIDKFSPLLIVLFVGSVSGIFFLQIYYGISNLTAIFMFMILLFLSAMFTLIIFNSDFYKKIIIRLEKFRMFSQITPQIKAYNNLKRRTAYKIIFISFLFYCCYILQYGLLVSAFSNQGDLINYFWAGILVSFVNTVIPPITLGELGIREGASVFFITHFGLSSAVGFNASLFLFFINVLIPSVSGLLFLFKRN